MRAFLSAAVALVGIAIIANFTLRSDVQSSSLAYKMQGVRLDPSSISNDLGRMPPHKEF